MLNWTSTTVLESRYDPAIRITFKKFSQKRKAMLELELAAYRAEVRDKMIEYADTAIDDNGLRDNDGELVLGDDEKPVHLGDSEYIKAQKRTRRMAFNTWLQGHIEQYIKPATLRTYVTIIEGLMIDGKPCTTVQALLDEGPEEIADEAYQHIMTHGGLPVDDQKNLPSPSTSPEVETQATSNTSANTASTTGSTPIETAENVLVTCT